jgi:endonuclease YncB( thermonuclease family)
VRRRIVPLTVALLLVGAAVWYANTGDDGADEATDAGPVATEPGDERPPPVAPAHGDTATARRIHDGDSFIARLDTGDEVEVRMIGINAPELGECLHHEARRALVGLLGDSAFGLERDVTDRDRHGRLLRYVRADGVLANVAMIESGLALVTASGDDAAHKPEMQAAQARARAEARGIWKVDACGAPASTAVHIVHVEADPPGNDRGNLNGEVTVIRNDGDTPVEMKGWKLRDDSTSNRFWFPQDFVLGPGREVTVHVGSGDNTDDALYWGRRYPIWDNSGDAALLLDPNGNAVSVVDIPPS